jgi:acyl carrier protein
LDTGVLDSLNLFLLLTFIEEQFGVTIEPEEIVPENFDTLTSITRLVQTHLET